MIRPPVQSSSTAAYGTGSEQQLESHRDISTLTYPLQHIPGRIMTVTLEDHEGTVSIGGRTIIRLLFADDIDGLAGEEEKLQNYLRIYQNKKKAPQPTAWRSVPRI